MGGSDSCLFWNAHYNIKSVYNPKGVNVNVCTRRTDNGKAPRQNDWSQGFQINMIPSFDILDGGDNMYCGGDKSQETSNYCNFIGDLNEDGEPEWVDNPFYTQIDNDAVYCHKWSDRFRADLSNGIGKPNPNFGFLAAPSSSDECNGHEDKEAKIKDCIRNSYSADPVVCCFKDLSCDDDYTDLHSDKCFQTPAHQRSCNPKYQNLNSASCRDEIFKYCTGEKDFGKNWRSVWKKNDSVNVNNKMKFEKFTTLNTEEGKEIDFALNGFDYRINSRKKYKFAEPDRLDSRSSYILKYDPHNFAYYSFDAETRPYGAINLSAEVDTPAERGKKYEFNDTQPCLRAIARNLTDSNSVCTFEELDTGLVLEGNLNSEGSNWSKDVIQEVFNRYKDENGGQFFDGIDKDFENDLFEICSKIPSICQNPIREVCADQTAINIENNPDIKRWCGCYLPDNQYNYPNIISRECQNSCIGHNSIPVIGTNGIPVSCIQNVCVMNNIDVELLGARAEEITFSQLCPGCGESRVKYTLEQGDFGYRFLDEWVKENLKVNFGDLAEKTYYVYLQNELADRDGLSDNDFPTAKITLNSSRNEIIDLDILSRGTEKFNDVVTEYGLNKSNILLFIKYYYEVGFENGLPVNVKKCFDPDIDDNDKCFVNLQSDVKFTTARYDKRVEGQETDNNYAGYTYQREINRCACIMENVDVGIINSTIKGNIDIKNNCGSMECKNEDGKPANCENINELIPDINTVLSERYDSEIKQKYNNISHILLATLLFLSVFFLIFYYIYKTFTSLFKHAKIN